MSTNDPPFQRTSELCDRDFQIRAAWVYASLAVSLGIYHALSINLGDLGHLRASFHEGILSGESNAPYQYRILVPFLAEAIAQVLGAFGVTADYAREGGYTAIRIASNFALFIFFDRLCRRWLTREVSLAATLLLSGLCVYTMRAYYFQPSSSVNIALLAAAAVFALEGRLRLLYVVAAAAALTRETSGLIVALFLAAQFGRKGWLHHTLGLFAVWAVIQLGLRFVLETAEPFPLRPWTLNLRPRELLWVAGLFGVFWLLPVFRSREMPTFLVRSFWLMAPPLIVLNIAFGKLTETRLFLDLALILLPAGFIVLFGAKSDTRSD